MRFPRLSGRDPVFNTTKCSLGIEGATEERAVAGDTPPLYFQRGNRLLVRGLVVAGFTTGCAVEEAVGTEADVNHGLAQAAVLLALAAVFRLFALCAAVFGRTGSGAHESNVARIGDTLKMTLVIAAALEWAHLALAPATPDFSVPYNSQQ